MSIEVRLLVMIVRLLLHGSCCAAPIELQQEAERLIRQAEGH